MAILEQIREAGSRVIYEPQNFTLVMLKEVIENCFYGKERAEEIRKQEQENKEKEEYYEVGGTWIKKNKIE